MQSDLSLSSSPADRPNRPWIFPCQLDLFLFMANLETFAFTERVLHLVQTDFDFQQLAAVGYWKSKCGVFFWRTPRPERQRPVSSRMPPKP